MSSQIITLSRREVFRQSVRASLASVQVLPEWMPRMAFANSQTGPKGDTLVCIFLRGGADGLNIIVPYGDAAYYAARPRINMARPDDNKADSMQKALDLDGFFGLHPQMVPLLPFFQNHQMVATHATGSTDPTRSHFEAMDFMERGTPGSRSLSSGWIGRHLNSLNTGTGAALRAIGFGDTIQMSLRGSLNATALRSILDYHLAGRQSSADVILASLNSLYNVKQNALDDSANETKAAVELLKKVNVSSYIPAHGAKYDQNSGLAMALMQTAAMMKADVGLEVSAIDFGGWDTHINALPGMAHALDELSIALSAFATDVSDLLPKTTVIVMSEFGRRVQENADAGTDHGHGNMMLVIGGNVAAQPVITKWPGLAADKLDNGDLAITTDYRDILSEILTRRLNNTQIDAIFPGYKPTLPGVVH